MPGLACHTLRPSKHEKMPLEKCAENTYDAIILGTGLKEGIVSALLSVHGKKVLHMDRNNFYGGDCASLRLSQLYEFYGEDPKTVPPEFGRDADWNIDLIPKFMLSAGDLFRMLRHADCLHYLEFGRVSGSYVQVSGAIHRVPATTKQALDSKLMGLLEKKRMANLLEYCMEFEDPEERRSAEKSNVLAKAGKTPMTATVQEYFEAYKLSESTQEFIGHCMALQLTDQYLSRPAVEYFRRIRDYCISLNRFGQSSFIYPLYGLGDIPQAFSRLAAVWGGTYMLNKTVTEVLYDDTGSVSGVRCPTEKGDSFEAFYAPIVVGDPSYFPTYTRKVGKVGRACLLLAGPIPACASQADAELDDAGKPIQQCSAQVIIPAKQCGRPSDIYVTTQGYNHRTTPKNMCLGFVSGLIYGSQQDNRLELVKGFDILNTAGIKKIFYKEYDLMEPLPEAQAKNIFVSKSYDATSHFGTTVADAISLYERITGEKLDLDAKIQRPAPPGSENVE